MEGTLSSSLTKADLMREPNSPMTTYRCEPGYHQDLAEHEKNPANHAANLVVKRFFGNGEEQ